MQRRGYNAKRTVGSRGFYDVCAINPREILFVQCKREQESERDAWTLKRVHKLFAEIPPLPESASFQLWIWRDYDGWTTYKATSGIVVERDPRDAKKLKCAHCKEPFDPRQRTQRKRARTTLKYCSMRCKHRAQNRRFYRDHRERMIARVLKYRREKRRNETLA